MLPLPAMDPTPPFPLHVHVAPDRERVTVAPQGDLEAVTVGTLAGVVENLRALGYTALRLDLRGLAFMDSSGLRYVLCLAAAAAQDGLALTVVPGPRAVQRVFDLTGTGGMVPFEPVAQPSLLDGSARNGRAR